LEESLLKLVSDLHGEEEENHRSKEQKEEKIWLQRHIECLEAHKTCEDKRFEKTNEISLFPVEFDLSESETPFVRFS